MYVIPEVAFGIPKSMLPFHLVNSFGSTFRGQQALYASETLMCVCVCVALHVYTIY